MAPLNLHVVSFNVPWPANYGGVIDVYYRLLSLARMGVHIDLHCFTSDREPAPQLEQFCRRVFYYKRRTPVLGLLGPEPYIVSSRTSVTLHNRLLSDNSPILFDGLHTTWYLNDPQLSARRKVVRMHNVEWEYYAGLAKIERHIAKEIYYQVESRRLRKYEKVLGSAYGIACISKADTKYYQQLFGQKADYVPAFHPYSQVEVPKVKADVPYALYHGNLSVGENVQAATWLVSQVFADLDIKLVIAGLDPDYKLHDLALRYDHVELIADPDEKKMDELIRGAQLHVLPTFQPTGIKLKLLRALFTGRHVLVNPQMVTETGLAHWVTIAESPEEWKKYVADLMKQEYTAADHQVRSSLAQNWSNRAGAEKLIRMLYN